MVVVANVGAVASSGAVEVADVLPSGFTATSISGSGWTCVVSTLACTRADYLAAGASYPPIAITVNIASGLTGNVTDSATVSGGNDQNSSNNLTSLNTFVRNRVSASMTSSPNPSNLGQSVTLTGTITPAATGKITFFDGTTILGEASILNGTASFTTELLSSGTRSLRALYSGNSTYGPASSALTQTVNDTPINGLQVSKSYVTDAGPGGVAVGDFNGDGKPDLVTANYQLTNDGFVNDISVLLGNGDGTFQPAVNYPTGTTPSTRSSLAILTEMAKPMWRSADQLAFTSCWAMETEVFERRSPTQ